MSTRMEMWKEYRSEIESNIELQKAVMFSNDKLRILYKRLMNAFPGYEAKYKADMSNIKSFTETMDMDIPTYKVDVLHDLMRKINITELDDSSSLSAIESLSFASGELDDVIVAIKEKLANNSIQAQISKTRDIVLMPARVVNLSKERVVNNMRKVSIAIDGPAGSGKSTVAKELAAKYNLKYINTGLVYRAIALNALNEGADLENHNEVISTLRDEMIELLPNEVVMLYGNNVTNEVRSDEASQGASKVSVIPQVREWAVKLQQHYGSGEGVIMDGRDTTFKIMPNADIKIFLDTSPEVRAQRRKEQNEKLGFSVDYDLILKDIKERDFRDRNRATDPLHKTEDAVLIDASNMTIKEVVDQISKLVDNR